MKTAAVQIFTTEAKNHVRGRPGRPGRPPIYGMLTFARIVGEIYNDSAKDNPYADYFLLKIEACIERCETTVREAMRQIQPLEQQAKILVNRFSEKAQPPSPHQEIPLNFASPYGFIGAHLLREFDECVQSTDLCTQCGLLSNRERSRIIKRSTRALRAVYHAVSAYKSLEVTRSDCLASNSRAGEAVNSMGEIPTAVLNGVDIPKYRPEKPHISDKIKPLSAAR